MEQPPAVKPAAETDAGRSSAPWSGCRRGLAALICTALAFKLYAGLHWSPRLGCGPGVTFSPTGCYVSWTSLMSLIVAWFNQTLPPVFVLWPATYAAVVVFPPALMSVVVYALLTHRYGPSDFADQPACRACGYHLRGLITPQCPECGEPI